MGKGIQKFFLIVSGLSFLISGSYGLIALFSDNSQQTKQIEAQKAAESKNQEEQKLVNVEKGFEKVLEREPDNQYALQNLVQIRMGRNDFKGAIAPMEKLVKLNPDNPNYKALLAELKKQATTNTEKKPEQKNPEPKKSP